MKILITSGGTVIPIDSVRKISGITNMSKGTFGSKIATEFLKLEHEVIFVKAKGSITPMTMNWNMYEMMIDLIEPNLPLLDYAEKMTLLLKNHETYNEYEYDTFDEYATLLEKLVRKKNPDIILLAAAVSDYGVENFVDGKVRSNDAFNIKLKQLPKLISKVKGWANPNTKLVGFKLLVDSTPQELIDVARNSVNTNNADMVVANDLSDIRNNNHKISLVFKDTHINYVTDKNDPNYLAKMVVKHSLDLCKQ